MRKRKNKRSNKILAETIIVVCLTITMGIIGYWSNIQEEQNSYNTVNTISSSELEQINIENIPKYKESPYIIINNNKPLFSEDDYTTKPFEKYSNLDSLGRCGVAYANICKEIMPQEGEQRRAIGSVKPTGWQTTTYDIIDGKYLYNRCHLIGYQLAGENANEKNLITGTRYMNVEGMLPFENLVDDYIEEHPSSHVLYRVTPIFEGTNLIANGVQMEAYSVEDKGQGICFNVYVYNVQPGIRIDYATGNSNIDIN